MRITGIVDEMIADLAARKEASRAERAKLPYAE
jgi:hypothetical protein